VSTLADDEMVASSIAEALDAGVPEHVITRIVAEEAALLDGTWQAFALSSALAAARLGNAAKAPRPRRSPPRRRDPDVNDEPDLWSVP
jgi:hypothetical protein